MECPKYFLNAATCCGLGSAAEDIVGPVPHTLKNKTNSLAVYNPGEHTVRTRLVTSTRLHTHRCRAGETQIISLKIKTKTTKSDKQFYFNFRTSVIPSVISSIVIAKVRCPVRRLRHDRRVCSVFVARGKKSAAKRGIRTVVNGARSRRGFRRIFRRVRTFRRSAVFRGKPLSAVLLATTLTSNPVPPLLTNFVARRPLDAPPVSIGIFFFFKETGRCPTPDPYVSPQPAWTRWRRTGVRS